MNNHSQEPAPPSRRSRFRFLFRPFLHVQRTLGAGILVILPIGITILVLKFFFDLLDPILEPATRYLPGRDVTGLGLAALVILVYLVGLVAAFVVGRRVIDVAHRVMEVIPVVKGIYSTTRAAVGLLATNNTNNSYDKQYSGVVLIDFPRAGTKSIGLITSRMTSADGEEMLAIYIPTTPIPSSGFLVFTPVHDVTMTDMSVEEAMRIVVSGGVLSARLLERYDLGAPHGSSSNH